MPEVRKNKTKSILKVSLIFIFFFLIYLTLVDRAQRIKEGRIEWEYKEGKISKEQYEKLQKDNSTLRILLNPKYVFETKD